MHNPDDWVVSDRVEQAVEVIGSQLGCDRFEALSRLIIQSAKLGQAVEFTALDVLDDVIRFDT